MCVLGGQLTVQGPISPPHALPLALSSLLQPLEIDINDIPFDVQSSISEMHLRHLGIDIIANLPIRSQTIEEAKDTILIQQTRDELGKEHLQLVVILAKGIEVYGIVDLTLSQQLGADLLPFALVDLVRPCLRTGLPRGTNLDSSVEMYCNTSG